MTNNKGWVCPVCGRGVAPWVDYCSCVGTKTSTSNSLSYAEGADLSTYGIKEILCEERKGVIDYAK